MKRIRFFFKVQKVQKNAYLTKLKKEGGIWKERKTLKTRNRKMFPDYNNVKNNCLEIVLTCTCCYNYPRHKHANR